VALTSASEVGIRKIPGLNSFTGSATRRENTLPFKDDDKRSVSPYKREGEQQFSHKRGKARHLPARMPGWLGRKKEEGEFLQRKSAAQSKSISWRGRFETQLLRGEENTGEGNGPP